MLIPIFAFLGVFVLIAAGGLLLFYREEMLQRISDAINPQPKQKSLMSAIQQTGLSLGGVVEHFESVIPKSQAEVSVVLQRLQRAGLRDESAKRIFYGSKALVPLALCAVILVSGLGDMAGSEGVFFVYLIALALGFLA